MHEDKVYRILVQLVALMRRDKPISSTELREIAKKIAWELSNP